MKVNLALSKAEGIVTVTPNPVLDRTLTVPRIVFNEMTRATASRLDWGCKGFNVSRALQALDVESVAMGFIGGATGRMLERGLNDMGISTDFVPIVGETRTNIVIAAECFLSQGIELVAFTSAAV